MPTERTNSTVRVMEEYKAKAMLLGMHYDPYDHTLSYGTPITDMVDADTMEPVHVGLYYERIHDIEKGKLGPVEYHGTTQIHRYEAWRLVKESRK